MHTINSMKKIMLTNGTTTKVCDCHYALVKDFKWRHGGGRYAMTSRSTYMHRIINNPPNGLYVDHINGDGLDNRCSNLRACTPAQNQWNAKTRINKKTSSFRGVYFRRDRPKPWFALIIVNGLKIHIGSYEKEEEAAEAYRLAALLHFGEYANRA